MPNFIELTTSQGPRAINIEHIQSFAVEGEGTRIIYHDNSGQEDVHEAYDVVRTMLNVTQAPRVAAESILSSPDPSNAERIANA